MHVADLQERYTLEREFFCEKYRSIKLDSMPNHTWVFLPARIKFSKPGSDHRVIMNRCYIILSKPHLWPCFEIWHIPKFDMTLWHVECKLSISHKLSTVWYSKVVNIAEHWPVNSLNFEILIDFKLPKLKKNIYLEFTNSFVFFICIRIFIKRFNLSYTNSKCWEKVKNFGSD